MRDSHGLFDHESKNKIETEISTQAKGRVIRDGNNVNFTDDIYSTSSMGEMLFNIERDLEGFYV